ncbi:hypothetical protein ACLKA6_012124 [Drosophila palustris]
MGNVGGLAITKIKAFGRKDTAPRRLHKLVTAAKAHEGYAKVVNNYDGRGNRRLGDWANRQQLLFSGINGKKDSSE